MSINAYAPLTNEAPGPRVPPLETGDCLARPEFERRYEAMTWLKKAELIDGVVYVGSPVGLSHADADARLTALLSMYAAHTPGVQCAGNAILRLDMLNEVQPASLLRLITGGRSRVEPEKQYLEGAPEVAASSVSRDLHSMLTLYLRHAVPEYVVWRVLDGELDWFRLEEGEYQRLTADDKGVLRSREFPGLWLDRPALVFVNCVHSFHGFWLSKPINIVATPLVFYHGPPGDGYSRLHASPASSVSRVPATRRHAVAACATYQ